MPCSCGHHLAVARCCLLDYHQPCPSPPRKPFCHAAPRPGPLPLSPTLPPPPSRRPSPSLHPTVCHRAHSRNPAYLEGTSQEPLSILHDSGHVELLRLVMLSGAPVSFAYAGQPGMGLAASAYHMKFVLRTGAALSQRPTSNSLAATGVTCDMCSHHSDMYSNM